MEVSLQRCRTMMYVVQSWDRCQSIVEHWRGGDTGGGTDWVLLTCYPTQWPEEKINPETGRYKTTAPWPDNRRPSPAAYHHSTAYSSWTPINLNTFCEYIYFLHDLIKAVYPFKWLCLLIKLFINDKRVTSCGSKLHSRFISYSKSIYTKWMFSRSEMPFCSFWG